MDVSLFTVNGEDYRPIVLTVAEIDGRIVAVFNAAVGNCIFGDNPMFMLIAPAGLQAFAAASGKTI